MDSIELELKLTVAQINVVLKHLAKGAYEEVADLITLLHSQAKPQVETASAAAQPAPVGETQAAEPPAAA